MPLAPESGWRHKNLPNSNMAVSKVKIFYSHCHLDNKAKVIFWHVIKCLVIMHLGYKYQVWIINGYCLKGICLFHCENENTKFWPIKSSAVTNFGTPWSTHLRCPQFWYWTPWISGLNLCHPTNRRTDKQTKGWMDGWTPAVRSCDELCWLTNQERFKRSSGNTRSAIQKDGQMDARCHMMSFADWKVSVIKIYFWVTAA